MAEAVPGPGVDAGGREVIDPTRNVLDLVTAAIKRQDDLREAEAKHLREIIDIRAAYDGKLREAESARIDANREVDVGAVQQAAQVAANQATTLASQVTTLSDALRNQVEATARAATIALTAALDPMQKDIADLRRAQYEAQGQRTQGVESSVGSRAWIGIVIAATVGFSSVILGIAGIVIALVVKP